MWQKYFAVAEQLNEPQFTIVLSQSASAIQTNFTDSELCLQFDFTSIILQNTQIAIVLSRLMKFLRILIFNWHFQTLLDTVKCKLALQI